MDLNMMMREQARTSLETQLTTAVANGDAEAALKITKQISDLAVQSAPKAPPFGDAEIRAELGKLDWFGVDPKKSAKALEFGKTMDPRKFSTAEAFAAAVVKAVDDEFKPAAAAPPAGEDGDDIEGDDTEGNEDPPARKPAAARRTDAPREGETDPRGRAGKSGPWTKLTDAPPEVRAEIGRAAAKFLPANATDDQKKKFNTRQLEAHYGIFQRNKGKK
jgi:hypothetical protein